jgi:hypothetical protein
VAVSAILVSQNPVHAIHYPTPFTNGDQKPGFLVSKTFLRATGNPKSGDWLAQTGEKTWFLCHKGEGEKA